MFKCLILHVFSLALRSLPYQYPAFIIPAPVWPANELLVMSALTIIGFLKRVYFAASAPRPACSIMAPILVLSR